MPPFTTFRAFYGSRDGQNGWWQEVATSGLTMYPEKMWVFTPHHPWPLGAPNPHHGTG